MGVMAVLARHRLSDCGRHRQVPGPEYHRWIHIESRDVWRPRHLPAIRRPPNLLWLLALNPMASLIECYRSSIFGTEHTEVQPAIIATAITLVVLVVGLWCFAFAKTEGTFTDSI
jgi:hypothetical protein